MLKLGFLASHNGSNMQAVVHAINNGKLDAVPRIVISNNRHSGALRFAEAQEIPRRCLNRHTHPDLHALDRAILTTLKTHEVNLVLLVGYMKLLGPRTIAEYRGRILNIHPALLPKYSGKGMYGMRVHRAVLAANAKQTGVTIHLADEKYDHGDIIAQCTVPVEPGDMPETLYARVLQREHRFLVETLKDIVDGRIPLPAH